MSKRTRRTGDEFDDLDVSPEIRRCLRGIKREVEGAYRDEVGALRLALQRLVDAVDQSTVVHRGSALGAALETARRLTWRREEES